MMNIGHNIKRLRQRINMTQDQVAEKLGVSYQAVSKWENNANTPDIALLPAIAELFGVSIDALFSDSVLDYSDIHSFMKDDDVIRVVQMRGTRVLKVSPSFSLSSDEPPIKIELSGQIGNEKLCNIEIYGHIISASSIGANQLICHQSVDSAKIAAGEIRCEDEINVSQIACTKLICKTIEGCHTLIATNLECEGNVTATNVTCDQIIYNHKQ